jgi:signal transduction histidine kinase
MMTSQIAQKLVKIGSGLSWRIVELAALILGHKWLTGKQLKAKTRDLVLLETNLRINEFLSIAGHEIKTPLASIKGYIQLAEHRLKNDTSLTTSQADTHTNSLAEARELLERTDQQINRLNHLVNQLLDISRVQYDMLEIYKEPCDLVAVAQEALQVCHSTSPSRTIELALPVEEDVYVMADKNRIVQVIVDYLSNALKYSRDDRLVRMSLGVDRSMACVRVRDEGPGIPVSEQERIWERLYRVPGIKVQNGSVIGLGIGLYISRTIIEQHHGQVGVQSAPGGGSTFWFTLPLILPDK